MKGKEVDLRNRIKQQEEKLAKVQARIIELQKELDDYLLNGDKPIIVKPVDNHNYCGKILYPSKKAANGARILINRDLKKVGKKPMKRSYFCEQCEAWHLTSIPYWMPFPEHDNTELTIV